MNASTLSLFSKGLNHSDSSTLANVPITFLCLAPLEDQVIQAMTSIDMMKRIDIAKNLDRLAKTQRPKSNPCRTRILCEWFGPKNPINITSPRPPAIEFQPVPESKNTPRDNTIYKIIINHKCLDAGISSWCHTPKTHQDCQVAKYLFVRHIWFYIHGYIYIHIYIYIYRLSVLTPLPQLLLMVAWTWHPSIVSAACAGISAPIWSMTSVRSAATALTKVCKMGKSANDDYFFSRG